MAAQTRTTVMTVDENDGTEALLHSNNEDKYFVKEPSNGSLCRKENILSVTLARNTCLAWK